MKLQDDAETDDRGHELWVDLDVKFESTHEEMLVHSQWLATGKDSRRSDASQGHQAAIIIAYEEHFQG